MGQMDINDFIALNESVTIQTECGASVPETG